MSFLPPFTSPLNTLPAERAFVLRLDPFVCRRLWLGLRYLGNTARDRKGGNSGGDAATRRFAAENMDAPVSHRQTRALGYCRLYRILAGQLTAVRKQHPMRNMRSSPLTTRLLKKVAVHEVSADSERVQSVPAGPVRTFLCWQQYESTRA